MGLGVLRFCLSLLVIDAHYGFAGHRLQMAMVGRFGVDRLAYIGSGGIAVSGFFVVSGYLITLVLSRKYDAGWHGAKAFYVSRALRIYPLYWLVFAAYWMARVWLGDAPPSESGRLPGELSLIPYGIAGMAADQNVFGLTTTDTLLIGPAWTLCYDLLFYLLAPWLFVRVRTCRWVAALSFAYVVAFIVFADHRPPVWFQFFYGTGMPYLFMFACGALAYHYRSALQPGAGWMAALIVGLVWVTYFPLGMANAYLNSLVAVLLFTPLVAMLGRPSSNPRVDRLLGDLTYATYLLHLPLLLLAQRLAFPHATMWALALTYLLSVGLLLGFEYPLDRWRDRLYVKSGQGRTKIQPGGVAAAIPVLSICLLVGAAIASLWSNGWRAGSEVELRATICPERWRCDSGKIAFDGAGEAKLAPSFPAANRIVLDLQLPAGTGGAWIGVESDDGRFRAGIRRVDGACHLESAAGEREEGDPPGWNVDCRTRRLVLNHAADRLFVVVDSLWALAPTAAPAGLHAIARSDAGSRGTLTFANAFVTRR